MDFNFSTDDDHSRTIIHVDLDCFYAQVEMIKNPSLYELPLGIRQKNIVVTSNYVARKYGVKKCMLVSDAVKVCPNLTLVNGEDLHEYRQVSFKVTALLQKYTPLVERLGLDENYLDVTSLVEEKLKDSEYEVVGNVFGDTSENCQCGCEERLKIGTNIALTIRNALREELQLTSCAGVAHNKLLAKLAGSRNKPNQQTVVFPNSALELILSVKTPQNIPGIGKATAELLESIDIKTISDMHSCDLRTLEKMFASDKAKLYQNLCYGIDNSPVKVSGRPQSIGLEDSCRSISIEAEVREKFGQLLNRSISLLKEDGRLPRTLKLTVRKFDKNKKTSHRETRQCNVNPSLFIDKDFIKLTQQSENKLMGILMHLFTKLVDVSKPFHITLLGLSFTKFQERYNGKSSIVSFLRKNVEVQSVTSIESTNSRDSSPCEYNKAFLDTTTDSSESDVEPSPKKSKIKHNLLVKRRFFNDNLSECASPSKLPVAELRLNSTENLNDIINCPPNADEKVFRELPNDVQKELWDEYVRDRDRESRSVGNSLKKAKTNTLLNYFTKN